jgi:hypothetical protein
MRAALLDNPRAQEKLSATFEQGETDGRVTIAADLVQADYWFRLAARNPFHDNSKIRGAIEPNMTSDEMDAAKRLVDAWRPREFAELKTLPLALPAPAGASPRLCPAVGLRRRRPPRRVLFLRLAIEAQRIALGRACLGGARRLGLGDVAGEDRHHASAKPVRSDHHGLGAPFAETELGLQHRDDEFARRIVVVEQDHFVQTRPFGLGDCLGLGNGDGIAHRAAPCGLASVHFRTRERERLRSAQRSWR